MGSVDRIKNVARRVAKWHSAGHQVVVVPSAMAGETNRLIGLAREIMPEPDQRELDMVTSTGEQVSVGLLSMALMQQGKEAVSFTGWQVPVKTDTSHTTARIQSIDEESGKTWMPEKSSSSPAFRASVRMATSLPSDGAVPTRQLSLSQRH